MLSNCAIDAVLPGGDVIAGGPFEERYFLSVFLEMPNSRATRARGSLSRRQRIRMVSHVSNEINPLALRSAGQLVVPNLFERSARHYARVVNSFQPLSGQFLAAVSKKVSSSITSESIGSTPRKA
jgi:hypothetical protein